MITVKTNSRAVRQGFEEWLEKAQAEVEQTIKGASVEVFKMVLRNSPQFSGDFVGNWNYSVGEPDYKFEYLDLIQPGEEPFIMGDSPAINYAIAQNAGRESGFNLGDTIYFANSAEHDTPYAVAIEENAVKFRIGNIGAPLERTVFEFGSQYKEIGKHSANAFMRNNW